MKRKFVVKASCNRDQTIKEPIKGSDYSTGITTNDMNTASDILQRILDSDPMNLGMSADADYYLQAVIDELTNASYNQSSSRVQSSTSVPNISESDKAWLKQQAEGMVDQAMEEYDSEEFGVDDIKQIVHEHLDEVTLDPENMRDDYKDELAQETESNLPAVKKLAYQYADSYLSTQY